MKGEKIYKAKVDGNWFFIIGSFIVAVIYLVGITTNESSTESSWVPIVIVSAMILAIYYLALRTRYILSKEGVHIKWLWYQQELPYKYIDLVKKSNYPSSGRKFGWAAEGVLVLYSKGNQLYISPINRDQFISDLNDKLQSNK